MLCDVRSTHPRSRCTLALLAAGLVACAGEPDQSIDAGAADASMRDAASTDRLDASSGDDSGSTDAGATDDASAPDAGPPSAPQTGLLLRDGHAMPCADPTVVSERDERRVYYVYCTGMSHVWRTSDWDHFRDVRDATTFDLAGMSANGRSMGSWWAPTVIYAPGMDRYFMWVSVPDSQGERVDGTWDTRSLAALSAPYPTGPWRFEGLALDAAKGDHYIDPELFLNPAGGGHFVYWKQYGRTVPSRIMGARATDGWTRVGATHVAILNGYGGPGTWEDNVRENPAAYYDVSAGTFHLIWSGGHWRDSTYATGHSISDCGALCVTDGTGWRIRSSGDRGIVQVVQAIDLPRRFEHGGPGGADFQDDEGRFIVYAAAARSPDDATRYLMRDRVRWRSGAPYVDRAGHHPTGF